MTGKFIVIEGLEGAGKTTARQVIVDTLRENGITDWSIPVSGRHTAGRKAAHPD